MEAVPKLPMISFELKGSPETTHFGPKLKQYIAEAYRESPDNYAKEMHQLEGLRSAAVRPSSDDAGLAALTKYFCQLRAMQSRFPMAKGAPASVTFVWKDLYANMNCTSADIRFEMACILYNVGALHTQLGASEPRTTPESLKAACTHYQHAAWCFQYLKEHYPQPPGVDVSPEIMRLLQEICFAQAQECILDKSIQDTKTKTVGAVATQVMYFYNNCLAILGPSTGQDNIHEIIGTKLYNYWHRYLSFKHSYVGCIVCLYQGMIAETEQNMGERVAYYQSAVDKLGEARKLAKYIEPVAITQEALTFTNDVVEGKRKAAKNENEFIYHEEVPDKNLLVDLKPVCVVKALPINFKDPEVWGPDLFARLIPICAHEASSLYSEEKAKLLRRIGNQVESKTMELTEFMSSLQLDQLDMLDSEQKIPQEIVDRCAAMNAKSEIIQSLIDSMNNLAEIISDVEDALAECKNFIQEDTAQEKEYQKSMGPRPPSIVQTELSREYNKYQEAHSRTNESNQVLHKAMTLHIANLRLLAQPLDYLQAKIPNVENIVGLDRETMLEMRRVVGKAREMQAQRDSLLQELRDELTADDITGTLLARASQVPDEEIFAQEIEKHTPKVKIIEQNLAAQENIINRLTSLYAAYGESRRLLADVLRKREGLINALITSYDTYSELLSKSGKGAEFYRKLAHNVGQLQARLRSTCQVQAEEREQLLNPTANRASADSPPASKHPPAPAPTTAEGYTPRLKDYLPYMKGRYGRATPQAEVMPAEPYYPETIYPTTVRPAPVGSEATTDAPQMQYPDGYVAQNPNQYIPYSQYPTKDTNLYNPQNNYGHPVPTSGMPFEPPKDTDCYGYSSAYTPPQFSGQSANPQNYNPYYTATQQDSGTAVTESQYKQETIHPNTSQYNPANNQAIMIAPGMSQYNPGSSQANVNPNTSQYNAYQYAASQAVPNPATPIPEAVSSMSAYSMNQPDLSLTFSQMNVSDPKPATYDTQSGHADYSQTYYSVAYPMNATSPHLTTYSHAPHNSNTSMVQSQTPSDYPTPNYPFGAADQTVPTSTQPALNTVSNPYTVSEPAYNYASTSGFENPAQEYPIYTNADNTGMYSTATSTVSAAPHGLGQPYTFPESDGISAATLANLDAIDKPIKSHVTGEALSVNYFQPNAQQYPSVASPVTSYTTPTEQRVPQSNQYSYNEQTSSQFVQPSQNHPGYTFNATSGSYDYNYGSQNSHSNYNPAQANPDPGVYTSAGTYATVQSPSESHQIVPEVSNQSNELYYINQQQYGYQTIQPNDTVPDAQSPTNYGANVNQSTYVHSMQSGQGQATGVTYTNNQVSTPVDNVPEAPNFNQSAVGNNQTQNYSSDYQNLPQGYQPGNQSGQNSQSYQQENNPSETSKYNHTSYIQVNYPNEASSSSQPGNQDIQTVPEPSSHEVTPVPQTPNEQPTPEPKLTTEEKPEQTTFDLLSDIDFSVEIKPLMPEIKVPQISEIAVKKPIYTPKEVPRPAPPKVEELIRPAKKDLFSDPGLMNKFTEEVKSLQKFVDSMTSKTVGGVTLLDAKWKTFQDVQSKENMKRSKNVALNHTSGNIVTEVVPYDDSRLMLNSDPDAYINASCYKQLAPWCIPLVISKSPAENDQVTFWKAVLENKISCIVCLLSEIEMQGKCYWPTAIGHTLEVGGVRVTLEEASCNVHWTERRLAVAGGGAVVSVAHYQINVFPAKIVCSPLVLLADKMLSITYEGRLSNQLGAAWVHCSSGAGRSAVLALLTMLMCQVRAGQINLCDMIDAACSSLYKQRSNVLEDTKYLADAYRTALFYVQGVLCSGTTSFNGETITTQSGASILPPVNPTTSNKDGLKTQKFSRESFEEMKQTPGLTSGDMKDPLNFLDPLWSLKKK